MICYSNSNTALFFSSVDKIPTRIWDELKCTANIYFHPNFINALEKNHPDIIFSYIVLVDQNNQPIAFASIKIIDFYIDSIKNDLKFLKNIGRKLHVFPDKNP